MSDGELARRARTRGAAVLLVTFISGALAGAAIMHVARVAPAAKPAIVVTSAAPPPPERVIENMKMARTGIPVLYETLDLTPAQRFAIARIMEANRPRTDSLLRETWPRLRALLDSIQLQVEQVLTPEQRARLADLRRGRASPGFVPNSSPNGRRTP
jgi:Spy/CpxP family protein refolding chaperone